MTDFYDVMTLRRSNYSLDDRVELSEPQIMELINHAVKQCPSAFNSQSARVIVLFNEHQQKFWNLTLKELEKVTPKDKFANTEKKSPLLLPHAVQYCFLRMRMSSKGCKTIFRCIKTNFRFGLNRETPFCNMPFGACWLTTASGLPCNTTRRWLTALFTRNGKRRKTGNLLRRCRSGALPANPGRKIISRWKHGLKFFHNCTMKTKKNGELRLSVFYSFPH